MRDKPISYLRRRMTADMTVRSFSDKTQHDYIRHIETFARFRGRSPIPRAATTSAASSSHRSSRVRSHRR
jgi:hypothetical protein